MNSSVFLQNLTLHPSWQEFFSDPAIGTGLKEIEQEVLPTTYTPAVDRVLTFATVDLKQVKAIWLVRDPYPQQGVATGKSFEVNGVTSWFDPAINSSLKNIIKLMHKAYFRKSIGSPIEEVRANIENGSFPILPPDKAFSYWEYQGVLFLNTAFTCKVGGIQEAGSHISIWKPFFKQLQAYIVLKNPTIKYFLWGDARKYAKPLQKFGVSPELLYLAKHPCTNGDDGGYQNGTRFLNCTCFQETIGEIEWIPEKELLVTR